MPNANKIVANVENAAAALDAAISIGAHAASLLPTHRQCNIEIANKCSNYSLQNPSVHMESGFCAEALPLAIGPSSVAISLFTKTPNTARGAVGVFTFNLLNKSTQEVAEKIAVMFSVPYDFNLYSNWYAVGIFDKNKECNSELFCHMYNNTNDETFTRNKAGPGINHKKGHISIIASMTDNYQPVIKVEVSES